MKQIAISLLDVPESDWKFEIKRLESHNRDLKELYSLEYEPLRLHLDKIEHPYIPREKEKFSMSFLERMAQNTHLECDLHLMVKDPINVARNISKDVFKIVYIHHTIPEMDKKIDIQNEIEGLSMGRAFNPDEPVINHENILIMTVFPGKGGQKIIIPNAERKNTLIDLWKGKNPTPTEKKGTIACDGGVTDMNIHELVDFSDIFVIGSNYFRNEPEIRFEYLKRVHGILTQQDK